jgi:hypothetical protein
MNNNKLKSLINLYGGNDEPNIYTSSLLKKYTNKNEKNIIKIDNLKTLFIDESESENDIFQMFEKNNFIKLNNLNDNILNE